MPRCQNRERGRERRREGGITGASKINLQFHGDPFPLLFRALHAPTHPSSLATSRVYSSWNLRARERERWEKETLDFTLTLKINCRRESTTLVRNNCRNWRKKQRIRTPFSLRGNLINSKDLIILSDFRFVLRESNAELLQVCEDDSME